MDNGQFYSVSDDKKEKTVEDKHKMTKAFRTPWLNKGYKNHNESDVPKCVYAENLISYFNKAEVKTALHVDDSFISGTNKWGMCISNYANNTDTNFTGNYTMEIEASQWIWETLINASSYRLLKFSGDMDMSVPSLGTQGWIDALNLTEVNEWREWTLDNYTAGYVTEYQGGMVYATVH